MMTMEEKEQLKKEKDIQKLKDKGFKKFSYMVGGKVTETKDLIPYKCKNYTGRNGSYEFFAQTNKGKDMATKLILRDIRKYDKELRLLRKDIKEGVGNLKKTIERSKK